MSKKFFANNYVQIIKLDGLLTYIDALKCEEFLNNYDEYFSNIEVITFDVTHHGSITTPSKNNAESSKTIPKGDFKNYPENNKEML